MRLETFLVLFAIMANAVDVPLPLSRGTADISQGVDCVSFKTPGRLAAGQSFTAPIGRGLEIRLIGESRGAWSITAGPSGTSDDYLWVVSPPFRTAPHRMIGSGYGIQAVESARLSPRRFRFVTSPREYNDARQLAEKAMRDASGRITVTDIERKGNGSLELSIIEFGSADAERLTWIRVSGRACQPR